MTDTSGTRHVLWINSMGEMGRTEYDGDRCVADVMCPGLGSPDAGGNIAQARALFGRDLEAHEWKELWEMQARHFLDGPDETALYDQWSMVFGCIGEAERTFTGLRGGTYGFLTWVHDGHVMLGWEPWHAAADEPVWAAIERGTASLGGCLDDIEQTEEDGVMMRHAQISFRVDAHTSTGIISLCQQIADGLDDAMALATVQEVRS